MATRKAYVDALKRELAHLEHLVGDAVRIDAVKAELARFSDVPDEPTLETAGKPGPISRSRGK